MKKFGIFLIAAGLMVLFTACGAQKSASVQPAASSAAAAEQTQPAASESAAQAKPEQETPAAAETTQAEENKVLVIYFSRTGNTKQLAEYAVEHLNADSFEIEAAVPYTDADIAYYTDCRADREQKDPDARPEIANRIENIEQYDTILLGYPIWHGQAPRIISTLLESYDFSGKTILPFCTSASSGIGNSDTDLHRLVSADVSGKAEANWKAGKRFAAGTPKEEFIQWIDESGI